MMRIRILDRILVALAGLIIIALCAGVVAQVFFGEDVSGWISCKLSSDSTLTKILFGLMIAVLLAIGLYCVMVLFRHRRRKDRFIMQKMESGDLAISLKALESMIAKCIDQHKEIQIQNVRTENQRDGLVVNIRGTVAGGISIPLTVDALQKQIKQYVTACSGIEVKGVKVLIESSGAEAKDAMFAIDAPVATPLLREAEKKAEQAAAEPGATEPEAVEKTEQPAAVVPPASKSAAEAALEAAENLKKEYEDTVEDERPIHQRLFSTPEEPCIMPLPPEKPAEEIAEETVEKAAEDAADAEIAVEKDIPDIVTEPEKNIPDIAMEPETIPEIPEDEDLIK